MSATGGGVGTPCPVCGHYLNVFGCKLGACKDPERQTHDLFHTAWRRRSDGVIAMVRGVRPPDTVDWIGLTGIGASDWNSTYTVQSRADLERDWERVPKHDQVAAAAAPALCPTCGHPPAHQDDCDDPCHRAARAAAPVAHGRPGRCRIYDEDCVSPHEACAVSGCVKLRARSVSMDAPAPAAPVDAAPFIASRPELGAPPPKGADPDDPALTTARTWHRTQRDRAVRLRLAIGAYINAVTTGREDQVEHSRLVAIASEQLDHELASLFYLIARIDDPRKG